MELKFILESLLFSSQKPLNVGELREILDRAADDPEADEPARSLRKLPAEQVSTVLEELAAEHEQAGRSYRLVCVAGAWQFVNVPECAPWLRAFFGVRNRPSRLSQPALETLAIIAYRQPITRAEIEQIRGVAVDGVMATLKERGLVVEAGRAEVIGRPLQYATSPAFLEYFGLAALDDLPAADELRRIPVQRPEALLTADGSADPSAASASDAAASPEAAAPAAEPAGEGESGPAGDPMPTDVGEPAVPGQGAP